MLTPAAELVLPKRFCCPVPILKGFCKVLFAGVGVDVGVEVLLNSDPPLVLLPNISSNWQQLNGQLSRNDCTTNVQLEAMTILSFIRCLLCLFINNFQNFSMKKVQSIHNKLKEPNY